MCSFWVSILKVWDCRSGWLVFLFYIGAFLYYLYIRIAKTLNLGIFTFYGIILLVVECMGATTVVIYGINLLFNPVHEAFQDDERQPGTPRVSRIHPDLSISLLSAINISFHIMSKGARIAWCWTKWSPRWNSNEHARHTLCLHCCTPQLCKIPSSPKI